MDHTEFKRKPNGLKTAIAGIVLATASGATLAATTESKVDLDFEMTCSFPLVGDTPVHVTGEADVPATTIAGAALPTVGIRFDAELDAQTIGGLNVVDLGFLGGSAEVDIVVEDIFEDIPVFLSIPIAKAAIPTTATAANIIQGQGTAPQLSFFDPGLVGFYINGITTKIEGFERDGSPANGAFKYFEDNCSMERYLVRTMQVTDSGGPAAGVSSPSIDFGKVAPGSSASEELTITSSGSSLLTIDSINTSNSAFSTSSSCLGASLSPGQTCVVDVTYDAPSNGTQAGTLTIGTNSGDIEIGVSGSASKSGTIDVAETVGFGVPGVGEAKTKLISIGNAGNASLNINGVDLAGDSDFVLVGNDCTILSPGESCAAEVVFSPSSEGNKSADLTINSNDPDMGSATVTLSGAGATTGSTGDSKVEIALAGEGTVQLKAAAAGKADLKGTFWGTVDRADGGIDFNMALDKTTAKLVGLGLLPLRVTMSFEQTAPIIGEFVNSEMSFVAKLDVYLNAVALNFFGFPLRLAGGNNCKMKQERVIPFESVGKVDLAGGRTAITGPLRLNPVANCGFLTWLVNPFLQNFGDSPINLDIWFTNPDL